MLNSIQPIPQTPRASAAGRAAFTLVELLLVIAIMAVLAAVILPQFNVGLSGAKVRAATMGYMQSARYARTMALLYQVETEIICEKGGIIHIQAGTLRGEGHGPYVVPEDAVDAPPEGASAHVTARSQPGRSAPSNTNSRLLSLPKAGARAFNQSGAGALAKPAEEADVSAEDLAEEGDVAGAIQADQTFDGVQIQFLGYSDEEVAGNAIADGETSESFHIRCRSNGTCRPYRVRISDNDKTSLTLDIDMLGMAEIEGEGGE